MTYLYVTCYTDVSDGAGVYRVQSGCGMGFGARLYKCKRVNTVLKTLLNDAQENANYYSKRCKYTIQRLRAADKYNAAVNDAAPILWEQEFFPQNLEV